MLNKIGEFSLKSGLSISTLRYYDDIGLLKPVKVDEFSGYRYYADHQLDDVEKIKELTYCGYSLEKLTNEWGHLTTASLNEQKSVLIQKVLDLESQINTLDYLIEHANEFGIGEESVEHYKNPSDLKLLTKTSKPIKHN